MRDRPFRPYVWSAVLGLTVLLLVAGCDFGKDSKVATDREGGNNVTPTALAAMPEDVNEASITISGGAFDVESVILQEGAPTVLHVVNKDDTAYRLKIGDALVTATPIAAGTTTDVKFTTPNAASYQGQLLAADSDQTIDTIEVRVQSAGGIQP